MTRMSKKNKEIQGKKLKVNPWRIIKIFLIAFLVFELIFFFSFQGANGKLWPLDNSFYYYTGALLIASAVFCYLSIAETSYEIEGTKLIHNKMGKVTEYSWSSIIYINEEFSEKKKMMLFYTKDGKEHELAFDKEGIIYKTALEKCNQISEEEFRRRFPNKKM